MIGQVIGNYVIVSELGKGGMGMVYRAEHTKITRTVALKMLLPQHSADPETVQRFFTEARAASSIDHPGIVEIFDFGVHDGRAYLVMEMLTGESLGALLARGALPPADAGAIVGQIVSVIAAAHARGIVHRDLKPDHIVLEPTDAGGLQVKLLDFGIAKMIYEGGGGTKTQTGVMIGTPAYMSPEQCMGRSDLDHRTDLYAIGCILFHALCGRTPFSSEHGTGMLIAAHLRDAPPDPKVLDPRIPSALAAITLRLLEKDPAARFPSALEVRAALVAAGVNIATTLQRPATPSIPPRLSGPPVASAVTHEPTLKATPAGTSKRTIAIIGGLAFLAAGTCVFAVVSYAIGKDAPPASSTGSGSAVVASAAGSSVAAASANAGSAAVAASIGSAGPGSGGSGSAATASSGAGSAGSAGGAGSGSSSAGSGSAAGGGEGSGSAVAADAGGSGSAVAAGSGSGSSAVAATVSNAAPALAGAQACAAGQTRSDDTRGHCCWPGQAWSSTKDKCVGAPACPTGFRANREACVEAAVVETVVAPTISLAARTYAPGAKITINFGKPISSAEGNKAFVTIAVADNPPSSFEKRELVADRARSVTLTAPTNKGDYEVRLFTDYPKENFKLAKVASFTVGAADAVAKPAAVAAGETPRAQWRFSAPSSGTAGTKLSVRFPVALHAKEGEQFWINVVKPGDSPGTWGRFSYLAQDASSGTVVLPTEPGDYELRMHANYPTKPNNIVHRAPLRVDPP